MDVAFRRGRELVNKLSPIIHNTLYFFQIKGLVFEQKNNKKQINKRTLFFSKKKIDSPT